MLKKILIVWLALLFIHSNSLAEDMSALEILAKVDQIISITDIKAVEVMTVYRKDGTVRPYGMNVMTRGVDKAFAEITAPPREKGRQTLVLGEMVWSYIPSIKKSIRVSGRGSFMGGDFENNDVLRVNLIEDYTAEIFKELPDQYVLGLKGKNLSLAYAKIKLWVQKGSFQPIKQEYYTISDQLIKSTSYQDITDFGGFKRPAKLVMQSALYPKQKTIMEIKKFEKGAKNPAKRFRSSSLGR